MTETTTPHEDAVIAVRRVIAEKHPTAIDVQEHVHMGAFTGLTFTVRDHALRYFYWADPTGAMPERHRSTRDAAVCVLLGRADRAAVRITPGALWTRAGEEQVSLLREDAGDCGRCGRQLAQGMFRWTNRKVDPDPYEADLFADDGRFPSLRHADGSPDCDVEFGLSAKNACPECLRPGVTFRDTGYGWEANCPHCGWQHYTDSGD